MAKRNNKKSIKLRNAVRGSFFIILGVLIT
jgi:hypothetical protein